MLVSSLLGGVGTKCRKLGRVLSAGLICSLLAMTSLANAATLTEIFTSDKDTTNRFLKLFTDPETNRFLVEIASFSNAADANRFNEACLGNSYDFRDGVVLRVADNNYIVAYPDPDGESPLFNRAEASHRRDRAAAHLRDNPQTACLSTTISMRLRNARLMQADN